MNTQSVAKVVAKSETQQSQPEKAQVTKDKDGFIHGGRSYRLTTRKGSPFYNLRFERQGKVVTHSLKTDIRQVAIAKAIIFLKTFEESQTTGDTSKLDRLRTKNDFCTIGEIVLAWEASIPTLKIAKRTAMDYIGQLQGLIKDSTGRQDVSGLRSNILTKELIDDFVKNARVSGRPDHSISSQIVHARSVFKRSRMDTYKNLKLPDLTMFRSCSYEFETNEKTGFVPFSAQEFIDLEVGAEQLYSERSPVWVAYILMSCFGLRNDMVYRLRWEDFVTTWPNFVIQHGITRFTVRGNYKEAKAVSHRVPVEIWHKLQAFRSPDDEYVVPARHKTARHEICYRGINAFMDRYIDRSADGERKKAYLLRRQFGSAMSEKSGVYAAQKGLGHRSVTTTEKYYGVREFESDGLSLEDLRAFNR
jgi:hypothetical protein